VRARPRAILPTQRLSRQFSWLPFALVFGVCLDWCAFSNFGPHLRQFCSVTLQRHDSPLLPSLTSILPPPPNDSPPPFPDRRAEEYLASSPDDVTAWISYAQMVKRPLQTERVVGRLAPGIASNSDISVSRESVFRARRVLHRALAVTWCMEHEKRRLGCVSSNGGEGVGGDLHDCSVGRVGGETHGRLMQALGLLELTHGNEMYGSALLEFCVHVQHDLRPVLLWHRVQEARRRQMVTAGVGRVNKMRANVGRLYCHDSGRRTISGRRSSR